MRTTIEITDEQRAQLMKLAARRGEKGFSKLVQQALDSFIESQAAEDAKRRRALALKGSLSDKDADKLRDVTAALRKTWR